MYPRIPWIMRVKCMRQNQIFERLPTMIVELVPHERYVDVHIGRVRICGLHLYEIDGRGATPRFERLSQYGIDEFIVQIFLDWVAEHAPFDHGVVEDPFAEVERRALIVRIVGRCCTVQKVKSLVRLLFMERFGFFPPCSILGSR